MDATLLGIGLSRFGAGVAKMVYAGALPVLIVAWDMTATEAGTVQAVFNAAYAVSLLVASWLADRIGAKRVFLASVWATALAFAAFAVFARSAEGALVLLGLVGLSLGGSYTPALMIVAGHAAAARRGRAVGWLHAASSLGYFAALVVAGTAPLWPSYTVMLLAAAAVPVLGAAAGAAAVRGLSDRAPGHGHEDRHDDGLGDTRRGGAGLAADMRSRRSVLLTAGYAAHCWELLGVWAWAPAFLTLALAEGTPFAGLGAAAAVAASLHLTGAVSTYVAGAASDRFGRRRILVAVALLGAALSFGIGWMPAFGPAVLLIAASAYGFAVIGDTGVLSAAMTEAVAPRHLGSVLALRSLLGFGAGALSPIVFGWVLDATNAAGAPPTRWGWAFATLGVGGALAALCAALLPRRGV
ncbi:MFS transporter [Azospirillum sp. ST 5-10]|uniref:MFS transporter n=1 Tax=unclassified Azospirillum TaxID=2630922 RepID=UPI003F4A41AD